MRDFAETKECRRQVLLDALGAEKAVCSGCDICNGEKTALSDWETALRLVKICSHYFTKEELAEVMNGIMNDRYRKTLGVNIWNNKDSVELIAQLQKSGRILHSKYFWKNKLCINKKAVV